MTLKSRATYDTDLSAAITDQLTHQNTATRVREIIDDLADSASFKLDTVEWQTDVNGTIATGGVAQVGVAATTTLMRLIISVPITSTGSLFFSLGGTAVVGSGQEIGPGQLYDSGYPPSAADRLAVSVISATTGATFTIRRKLAA